MKYRPPGWPNENPCIECAGRVEDDYGLLCNIACGKHTSYSLIEKGADMMLESLIDAHKVEPRR